MFDLHLIDDGVVWYFAIEFSAIQAVQASVLQPAPKPEQCCGSIFEKEPHEDVTPSTIDRRNAREKGFLSGQAGPCGNSPIPFHHRTRQILTLIFRDCRKERCACKDLCKDRKGILLPTSRTYYTTALRLLPVGLATDSTAATAESGPARNGLNYALLPG